MAYIIAQTATTQVSPLRPLAARSSSTALVLWCTYLNIALYALCYQLQRPIEPYLVGRLAENDPTRVAVLYGQLQAFFSAIQTVGSPLVGILLDRLGVRHASALVFAASAISYAILANADSLPLLFYSKIPTALQHAFLVAQVTAATATGSDDVARAAALARMTTAYTLGATLGPLVGGQLATDGDLYIGARLAVSGSILSLILSLSFLPDHTRPTTHWHQQMTHMMDLLQRSRLWPLLLVKLLGGVAASMHTTTLPMVLAQQLHFDPAALGWSMSSSMLAVAVFGAIGMAPLIRCWSLLGVARWSLLLRAMLGMLLAVTVSIQTVPSMRRDEEVPTYEILTVNMWHSITSHALATCLTTATTGVVEEREQGSLLGLEHGLFSMARIVGPPLGTWLLQKGSFWTVSAACGGVDVALIAVLMIVTTTTTTTTTTNVSLVKGMYYRRWRVFTHVASSQFPSATTAANEDIPIHNKQWTPTKKAEMQHLE